MSTTYRAVAAVGIVVDRGDLFQKVVGPECSHDIPPGDQFCPTCGRRALGRTMWIPLDKALDSYEPTLDGFPVAAVSGGGRYVVCLAWTGWVDATNSERELSVPYPQRTDIVAFKDKMVARGLWSDDAFGVHVVMVCG